MHLQICQQGGWYPFLLLNTQSLEITALSWWRKSRNTESKSTSKCLEWHQQHLGREQSLGTSAFPQQLKWRLTTPRSRGKSCSAETRSSSSLQDCSAWLTELKCSSSGSICSSHVGWTCETQSSSKPFCSSAFLICRKRFFLHAKCSFFFLAPSVASLQFLNEQQLCCSFKICICHHPFTSTLFSNVWDKD